MSLLHERLFGIADKHAERLVVHGTARSLSFGQFASRVQHLAGALESLGLREG